MRWLKYDLHMHSYASHDKDSNVKKMSASEFVEKLVEKEIDVFSLTDHNKFDTKFYNELYSFIEENYKDRIRLIPGTELDVSIVMNNGDIKYLHILFYFYEKYENIESTLTSLYTSGKPNIRQIIDRFNSEKYKFIIIPEGTGERGIAKFIKKMSPDVARYFNIHGMYKIFGGFDKTIKDTFNAEMWALDFYKKSSELEEMVKKSSKKILDKNIFLNDIFDKKRKGVNISDKDHLKIIQTISEFSSYLARFKFSDWHNSEEYNPEYYNYIFGDFNLPFESFELALIDPDSRLTVNRLDKIEINNAFLKELSFKLYKRKYNLNFTEGLNVIIGERGSGKSLLHSIIKSLKEGEDSYKRYTKNYNISDVVGILNNDQNITPIENYNSLEVIEQSMVEEYFEKKPEIKHFLRGNFKDLDEIDLSNIEKIYDLLNSIQFDIKIDDNIGPVISNIKSTNGYIIRNDIQFKNYSGLKKAAAESINRIDLFIKESSRMGYQIEKLSKIKDNYDSEVELIVKNIELIEQFQSEVTIILNTYILNSQKNLNRTQNAYQLVQEYMIRANDYLNSHLNNYQIIYQVENLKIDIPKALYNYHELGYIFRSRSKIKNLDEIKDDIKAEILSCITRGNFDQFNNELKEVLKGNKTLNKNKNPKDSVRRYIDKIDRTTDLHLFKLKDNHQIQLSDINDVNIDKWLMSNSIESVTDGSMGTKTVAYLDFAFGTSKSILLFDQPEDNIDNIYISTRLVEIIKKNKKDKQLIFVTHNPSIAVYADAFNYIHASQELNIIEYKQFQITTKEAKNKILETLDGGKFSFSNRNNKYGNIIGGLDYEN